MVTGKCFCGEIHYKIEADILKSGICHCYDCQRLTGGTAWPFIVIPQESLLVQGKANSLMALRNIQTLKKEWLKVYRRQ